MFYAIYDGRYPRMLLKTSRQVGKSTTIAAFTIAEAISIPMFKSYYVSPSREQTLKFSHTRVAKILAYSPELRRNFVGPQSIDNVLLRTLRNGSEMAFTYADDDPDRARGFSADRVGFDEVQSIIYDAVIPIIEECLSNSKYQYSIYAGTPLTTENTIEVLWNRSSMTEWIMKCTGCGKHSYIDSAKSLGKLGPECLGCRKALNPRQGFWVDMVRDAPIKGFHISQPIMPENVPAAWQPGQAEYASAVERWQKLIYKQEAYGETRFLNECIGVSTSTGIRLITKQALESLVDESIEMTRLPAAGTNTKIVATFAGVDWSGGGSEVKGHEGLFKSRTVLHIWGQRADGRLQAMYYKIFPNGHAVGWLDEIIELCNAWGVRMIIGDAGEGALANSMLRERLGAHRVIAVRYMSASKPMDWNPSALAYHCDRTTMIDNYARFLLHKQAVFPRMAQSKPAFDDILNVYEEVTANGRKVWKHSPVAPDDALHAQLFGWLGWRIMTQNLQFNV
jgi:hypothetical protein